MFSYFIRKPLAEDSSWIPDGYNVWRDIIGDNRSRANHGTVADVDARQNRYIRSYPDIRADYNIAAASDLIHATNPLPAASAVEWECADPICSMIGTKQNFDARSYAAKLSDQKPALAAGGTK